MIRGYERRGRDNASGRCCVRERMAAPSDEKIAARAEQQRNGQLRNLFGRPFSAADVLHHSALRTSRREEHIALTRESFSRGRGEHQTSRYQ